MRPIFWLQKALALAAFLAFFNQKAASQNPLYDDSEVPTIRIELPADSFQLFLDEAINGRYTPARFIFERGAIHDTVENVGFRLRGNTSLAAKKKSFRISFNEFEPGRKYRGVKKVNLRGSHNDPTMAREKLFYDIAARAGLPSRRANFTRVYVNGDFRGLYTNLEEVDDEWLDRNYGEDGGDLFKCTYPADLDYLGPSQQAYKNIVNGAGERAYDLKTNSAADDYSRLIQLAEVLKNAPAAQFQQQIEPILNVQNILKIFALEIACGHWDDYFYNKNNFFLYKKQQTGQFEMISYDADNTMGVDWLGVDWAEREAFFWLKPGAKRPLATRLLESFENKLFFAQQLDSIARFVIHPDSLFPKIDALRDQIAPHAADDPFRPLDYNYSMQDFLDGFEKTVDAHTPYGIKPFFERRRETILVETEPWIALGAGEVGPKKPGLRLQPTATDGPLRIFFDEAFFDQKPTQIEAVGTDGRSHFLPMKKENDGQFLIETDGLASGFFILKMQGAAARFFKF